MMCIVIHVGESKITRNSQSNEIKNKKKKHTYLNETLNSFFWDSQWCRETEQIEDTHIILYYIHINGTHMPILFEFG